MKLKSRLIVTTFLTALHLLGKVKPFTHILIDEGAQCREPEAIAPLCLADENSKIVVTGDRLQVNVIHYNCKCVIIKKHLSK